MSIVKETYTRTVAKTVLYRIFSIVITTAITALFGGDNTQMAQMATAALIVGTLSYYIHDRIWLMFGWNRDNHGYDSNKRSLIKTIVYRAFILVATVITAKIILGGPLEQAAGFAFTMLVANAILFFALEKLSNIVEWGKIYPVEPQENNS